MPSLVWLDGFEHQTVSTGALGGTQSPLYGVQNASQTIDTGTFNPGGSTAALKIAAAGSTNNLGINPGSAAVYVTRVYINITSVTTAGATYFYFNGAAGNAAVLKRSAGGNFEMSWAGTGAQTGPAWNTSQWYRVEIKADFNNRLIDWQIDGVAQTQVPTDAGASTNGSRINFGSNSGQTYTVFYDDFVHSQTSGDYPIGAGAVIKYAPNADGTHSVGADTWNKVTTNGGSVTAITNGTTDAYTTIDEWPVTADANAADDWIDKTAGTTTTTYVETAFADSTRGAVPNGVRFILAARNDSGTTTNALDLRVSVNGTEHATKIRSGTIGSATTVYGQKTYSTQPSGAAWTEQAQKDAVVRFYCTDVAPVPRLKGLLMEADFPPASAVTIPNKIYSANQAVKRASFY